ncbi:MAG: DNA-binding protein, partial [Planctomycetota bacterium]
LEQLMKSAVLFEEFVKEKNRNEAFAVNWSVVKDWSEEDRYELNVSQKDAEDLLNACKDEQNGVLSWIEKRW